MAIRGSCLCGGVTFEIGEAVGPVEHCHCNRCRKTSGSASLLAIGVRTEGFRVLTGRELIRTYEAPLLYEPPPYRSVFCSRCGSPVPEPEPEGEWFEIPAGVLDDDPGLRPERHILVELAPPWAPIADPLPRCTLPELHRLRSGEELPGDFNMRIHATRHR